MARKGQIGTRVHPPGPDTKAVPSKLDALEKNAEGQYGALEYPSNILDRSGHFIMFHVVETVEGSGVIEKTSLKETLKAAAGGFLTGGFAGALASGYVSRQAERLRAQFDIRQRGRKRAAETREALINSQASSEALTTVRQRPFNQKTVATIVLYMPEKVTTAYGFDYQGEALQIAAAGKGIVELTGDLLSGATTFDQVSKSELLNALGQQYGFRMAANFVDQLGSLVGAQVGAKAFLEKNLRRVVNPHMQFLFRAVNQRSFEYTFSLVPESPEDSKAIDNIIRTFKFFAHPEVLGGTAGRFHGYPAEFDIQYWSQEGEGKEGSGAVENDWFNRVGRCYLSNISVDYSGAGITSTHTKQSSLIPESLQGDTAQTRQGNPPTHITLSLTFNELETLNRQHIKEGF